MKISVTWRNVRKSWLQYGDSECSIKSDGNVTRVKTALPTLGVKRAAFKIRVLLWGEMKNKANQLYDEGRFHFSQPIPTSAQLQPLHSHKEIESYEASLRLIARKHTLMYHAIVNFLYAPPAMIQSSANLESNTSRMQVKFVTSYLFVKSSSVIQNSFPRRNSPMYFTTLRISPLLALHVVCKEIAFTLLPHHIAPQGDTRLHNRTCLSLPRISLVVSFPRGIISQDTGFSFS